MFPLGVLVRMWNTSSGASDPEFWLSDDSDLSGHGTLEHARTPLLVFLFCFPLSALAGTQTRRGRAGLSDPHPPQRPGNAAVLTRC